MKKYQIIGGQYESHWYGETDSLQGAKQIATRNAEHWDNWQGWHTPAIYLSENTEVIESQGRVTTHDGEKIIVPTGEPYAVKVNGKWIIANADDSDPVDSLDPDSLEYIAYFS